MIKIIIMSVVIVGNVNFDGKMQQIQGINSKIDGVKLCSGGQISCYRYLNV